MKKKRLVGIATVFMLCLVMVLPSTMVSEAESSDQITLVNNTVIGKDAQHIDTVQNEASSVRMFESATVNEDMKTVSFSEGYIDIKVDAGNNPNDEIMINPGVYTGNNLSVSDGGVISTVDDTEKILSTLGTVDDTYNGEKGWLRINFLSPMSNGDFSDGKDNWAVVDGLYNLNPGVVVNNSSSSITYSSSIMNDDEHGNYLYMNISGTTDAYGRVHGPYATSATFSAVLGDSVCFDWKAEETGDQYDVYAFIDDNGKLEELLPQTTGGGSTNWSEIEPIKLEAKHFANGESSENLKFVFICGTYDKTGGNWVGSNFSIDNVRVINSDLKGEKLEDLLEIVNYHSSDEISLPETKSISVSAYSPDTSLTYTGNGAIEILSIPSSESTDETNNTVIRSKQYDGESVSLIDDATVVSRANMLNDVDLNATYSSEYKFTVGNPTYAIEYMAPGSDNYVALKGTVTRENDKVTGVTDGTEGVANLQAIKDAGKYRIVASVPYVLGDTNISNRFYLYNVNITPKTLAVKWINTELVYTGEVQKPSASVDTGITDETLSLVVTGEKTEVGTHEAKANMAEVNKNYVLTGSTYDYNITQADNVWTTPLSINGWAYGDDANSPSATAAFGEVAFTYSDSENGTYLKTAPVNTGTHWVRAEVTEKSNYKALIDKVQFTINKQIQTTDIKFDNKAYGYDDINTKSLRITSLGNRKTTIKEVRISGDAFELNETAGTTIAPLSVDDKTYTVKPKADLAVGDYEETVTIVYNDDEEITCKVSFTVKAIPAVGKEVKGASVKGLSDEDVIKLFTKEELEEAALNEKEVKIKVETKSITPSEDAKELIEAAAAADQIALYLDVSLYKYVGDDRSKLEELPNEITIVYNIPEELQDKDKTFYIIREHNGEITKLKDLDDDVATITFKTNRFSTYALAYEENSNDLIATGDNSLVIWVVLIILSLMAIALVRRHMYKN